MDAHSRPLRLVARILALTVTVGVVQLAQIEHAAAITPDPVIPNRPLAPRQPCSFDETLPSALYDNSGLPQQSQGVEIDSLIKVSAPGEVRCLSGYGRNTRGRLASRCLSTLEIPTYLWYMCGSGPNRGIEAIAQARAVRQLNSRFDWGHISPDVQWEVRTPIGAADIVVFPTDGSAAQVIEVKSDGGGNTVAGASDQARDYATALTVTSRGPSTRYRFENAVYHDQFQILLMPDGQGLPAGDTRCPEGDSVLQNYDADGQTGPDGKGVIWVEPSDGEPECLNPEEAKAKHDQILNLIDQTTPTNEPPPVDHSCGDSKSGFTGTSGQLVVALSCLMDNPYAHELIHNVGLLITYETVMHLSRASVVMMADYLDAYLYGLANKAAVLQIDTGEYIAAQAEAFLRDRWMPALNEAQHAVAKGARSAAGQAAVEAFETSQRALINDTLDKMFARGGGEIVGGLGEHLVKREERAFVSELAARAFMRVGGRWLILGIPYIGEAVFLAWTAYDLYHLFKDLLAQVSWGDPHLITLDKRTYDLQTVGEFSLAEAPSKQLEIQARYVPWGNRTTVSIVSAIAIRSHDTRVQIGADGNVLIDGEQVVVDDGTTEPLDDGSLLLRMGTEYIFNNPDTSVQVLFDTATGGISMNDSGRAVTRGLLGKHDGNPNNDLALSDGTVLSPLSSPTAIHGTFADSWRVTDESSNFTYSPGQSTATFTDMSFPSNIVTVADYPPAEIEAATTTCRAKGVADGPQFEDCVYDVLVTGDASYANAAAAIKGELVDPTANGFGPGGLLTEDFTAPVASNFASPSYLNDPATSRVAGPFFDTPGYSFYVLNVPRHHQLAMTTDLVAYGPVDTDLSAQSVDVKLDNHAPISVPLEGEQSPTSTQDVATLTRVRTGTTATGTPFSVYRLQVMTDHVGTALKVQLTPHNFRGVLGTSLGVNSVRIQLTTSAPDAFDVAVPFSVSNGVPAAGAGNLEGTASEDDYRFHLDAPTSLMLDVNNCLDATAALVNTATDEVIGSEGSGCGDRGFRNVPAGAYTLRVWAPGAARTYALSLQVAPDPQSFTYSIGDNVADGSVGGVPTAGAGNLETVASRDSYTFTLTEPKTVLVTGSGACGSSQIANVLTGQTFGTLCASRLVLLPAGVYQVDVWTAAGQPVGAYSFQTFELPDGPMPDRAINTNGTQVVVGLGGEKDQALTFDAEAGHRYRVSLPDSSFYWANLKVRIVAPDGSTVSDSLAGAGAIWYVENAQQGTYRVVVDPVGASVGIATVRVKDVTDRQITVPTDGTNTAVAMEPGENAQLSFSADEGHRYRISIPDSNIYWANQTVRLFAPGGSKQFDVLASAGGIWYVEAALAGTYKFMLDPVGETAGTSTVRVKDVTDRQITVPSDGTNTNVVMEAGENAALSFNAVPGHRYRISIPDSNIYWANQTVRLFAPDGTKQVDVLASAGGIWYVEAAQAGTYKVVLDPVGETAGWSTVRVKDVTDKQITAPTDGTNTTVVMEAGENAQLSFTAAAGKRYRISIPDSNIYWANQTVRLFAPDGTKQVEVLSSAGGIWYVESAQAGTYRIVLDPVGETAGTTTVRVKDVTDKQIIVPTDGTNTAVVMEAGENAALSFTAVAGRRYRISTPDSNIYWANQKVQLFAPDGTKQVDVLAGIGGIWYVESAQAGTYKIVLDPVGETAGTTTVRVKDVTDKQITVPTDGTTTSVVMDAGENAQLTFNAVEGRRYRISIPDSNIYWANQKVQLFAPDGTKPIDVLSSAGGIWYVEAAQAGTYRIVLDPVGETTGTTIVRVKDVTDKQITVPTDGSNTAVVMDAGENAQLSFTAVAGKRYRISTPDSNIYWANQVVRVFAPDTTKLVDVSAGAGGIWYVESAQAGTYKVVLDPVGETTGTTTVRVNDATDKQIAAPTDGSDNVVALDAGQNAQLSFTGVAGHRYRVSTPSSSFYWANQAVRLFAPDGTKPVDTLAGAGGVWYVESAQAGTYKFVLDPGGENTGTTTVRIKDVSDKLINIATDNSDNTVTLDAGENAQLAFTAKAGGRYVVTLPTSTFYWANQAVRIVAPDGTKPVDVLAGAGGIWYLENTQAGTYKVVLDPVGESTGTSTIRVNDISDKLVTASTNGSDNQVTFAARQNAQVTFAAEQGHRYRIALPTSSIAAANLRTIVTPPAGAALVDTQAGPGWSYYVDPASAGTYTVSLDPAGDTTGSLNLTVKDVTAPAPTGPYADVILGDQPSAWYRLNDTDEMSVADSSGNGHNGQLLSPLGGRPGLIGSTDTAMEFDGANERYVRVPNAPWLQSPTITVEAWVKADTLPGQTVIVGRHNWSYSYGPRYSWLLAQRNGYLYWEQAINNGSTPYGLTSPVAMTPGQTYHVVVTYDGAQMRMYMNGVGVASTAMTGPLSPGLTDLTIGRPDYPRDRWDGIIDEVAIYPRALTTTEVGEHYTAGGGQLPAPPPTPTGAYANAVVADSPSAWYRFNEASGTQLTDSSGNFHHGVWISALLGRSSLVTNDTDPSAEFDGTERYARVANSPWLQTPNITVETWLKADSPIPGQTIIVGREYWNASYGNRYSWMLYQNSGKLSWEQFVNDGSSPARIVAPTALVAGQTYHVAVTFNGTTARMYVNGVEVGSVAQTGNLSPGLTDLTIGRPDYARDRWDGILDEMAIYPTALSAARILAHYNAGIGS